MTPTKSRPANGAEKWIELMLITLKRHLILHSTPNNYTLPTKMIIGRNLDAMRAGAQVHANHIGAINGAIVKLISGAQNQATDLKRDLARTPWYRFRMRRDFKKAILIVQVEEAAYKASLGAINGTFPPVVPQSNKINGKAPAPHG